MMIRALFISACVAMIGLLLREMRKYYGPWVFLLVFASAANAETVFVARVNSGDSFTTLTGREITLHGVKAPAIRKPGGGDAWVMLNRLVGKKTVELRNVSARDWSRETAIVVVSGRDAGLEMIRRGHATIDTSTIDSDLLEVYRQASTDAAIPPVVPHSRSPPRVVQSPVQVARRNIEVTFFSFPGCGPCLQTKPHFMAAVANAGVPYRVVTGRTMECVKLGINRYPTTVVSSGGVELGRLEGMADEASIAGLIERLRH